MMRDPSLGLLAYSWLICSSGTPGLVRGLRWLFSSSSYKSDGNRRGRVPGRVLIIASTSAGSAALGEQDRGDLVRAAGPADCLRQC